MTLWMKIGSVVAGSAAFLAVVGSAAGTDSRRDETKTSTAVRPADPDVIDFAGLRDIRLGASMNGLEKSGAVTRTGPACGPTFTATKTGSPVFAGDRLVLIWAHAPLRTPEGVMVGTSVAEARKAYPSATALTPRSGSPSFPGLLVTGAGDRAYLLLHDQGHVQKLVVGYERYVRLLFERGFGAC